MALDEKLGAKLGMEDREESPESFQAPTQALLFHTHLCLYLVSCRCDKIPDKSNISERGFIWLMDADYDPSLKGRRVAGA